MHSSYSDGSGTIKEIAQAANEAGIDFVVVNDHFTLKGLYQDEEKYYDKVLMLIGTEINKKSHHYLAMNVHEEIKNNDENPQKVIDEVARQGGIGFIAHPFEVGSPLFFQGKTYTWDDWSIEGYTGICVWNYCSQWRDGAKDVISTLYTTFINPHWRIFGPCPKAMAKIDELGQNKKLVLIGGTDAHAVKVNLKLTTYTVFPYRFLFRTVNTHVLLRKKLTGLLVEDKQAIYQALQEGACFIAFDYFEQADGFRFWIEDQDGGEVIYMGQEGTFKPGMVARAIIPKRSRVRLVKNGSNVTQLESDTSITIPINDKGVYRIEVFLQRKGIMSKKYFPWIFSNPIFVR